MANISVPIQINLPDDWLEQIIERLKNDPEAEWAVEIRCKDCKYYKSYTLSDVTQGFCNRLGLMTMEVDDFCSRAERREK